MIQAMTGTLIGKLITTMVIGMIPVIELRGAIPYGVGFGLSFWAAFVVAFIGNMLPIPFLIWFLNPILAWIKEKIPFLRKFTEWLERKAEKNSAVMEKYEKWGLLILVAIPLPGTGAWTGALVASFLGMKNKTAFPIIALGVLIAGFIVSGVTWLVTWIA